MAFPTQNRAISLLVHLLVLISCFEYSNAEYGKVPAIYVFGDSTADVGNNNYLLGSSVAKANFPHNGVDFPSSRPTGRFSNGYNGIDFLAIHMGFRRSPLPFLSVTISKSSQQIFEGLRGVNFASAGSGILDSTGTVIAMRKQIDHFANLKSNITARIAREATEDVMTKSIFIISSGGNDIFAFFARNNSRPASATFVASLVSELKGHVEILYKLGARKFGIVDVPPIGCLPYARSQNPLGGCIDILNELVQGFNNAVKDLMHKLSFSLNGLKYSVGSSYAAVHNIMKNPIKLGFKEIKSACCGYGKFNGQSACMPNSTYCSNRHEFLFWDQMHPTHAASKLVALAIYSGPIEFASPINFKQLVEYEI